MSLFYACTHTDEKGKRCSTPAIKDGSNCDVHQESESETPEPNSIWVRFAISKKLFERLSQYFPVREKQESLSAGNTQAEGTAVFGKGQGLPMASVREIEAEMKAGGYRLVCCDIYFELGERGGDKYFLQLIYVKASEKDQYLLTSMQEKEVDRLWRATWKYMHVWVNPRNSIGRIVHGILCLWRQDNQQPENLLLFNEGLYDFESLTEKFSVPSVTTVPTPQEEVAAS